MPSRRSLLKAAPRASLWTTRTDGQPPNIVLMIADDLGYGDPGCYGSTLLTPNLDSIAAEGVKLNHYVSANPVCSPSRASLLTGRYPTRTGVDRVLFPHDSVGLPQTETTIAGMLKHARYRTACVGKWHLGDQPQFMPTSHGFDDFYGVPYSSDMYPVPLVHNLEIIERPTRTTYLTRRFTEQAVRFLSAPQVSPFFLYMAYTAPHIPLWVNDEWRGKSLHGLYGDTVAEMDWSVGQILKALKDNRLDDNTLVIFTSDHGPWYEGSAGRLKGRKGETWEGGVRVPFLARFPGRIPAGLTVNGTASALDLLPTIAGLAGVALPGLPLDGIDIRPMLSGAQDAIDREAILYFDSNHIQCARLGRWKLHLARYSSPPWSPDPVDGRWNLPLCKPELYDLIADPTESCNVACDNADVVADIQARVQRLLPTLPSDVIRDWCDTNAVQVAETPDGALPVRKKV